MTNWNLLREMDTLWREVDDIFRGRGFELASSTPVWAAGSYPQVTVQENQEEVLVEALLPGIDPKSLDISVLRNSLTLAGERRSETFENASWHRRERRNGTFMRTFDLPAEIDADKVQADYQHGVLKITLPKAEAAKPKRIEIKA